jgi:hypothetical protein
VPGAADPTSVGCPVVLAHATEVAIAAALRNLV